MQEKTLQQVLYENKIKVRKEEIRKQKEEKKANRRVNIVIGLLLILAFMMLLSLNKKMTDNAMTSCQEKGNNYDYCIAHI